MFPHVRSLDQTGSCHSPQGFRAVDAPEVYPGLSQAGQYPRPDWSKWREAYPPSFSFVSFHISVLSAV